MNKGTWGLTLADDAIATARIWAPDLDRLSLKLEDRTLPMEKNGDGWFEVRVDRLEAGDIYGFVLPDGRLLPDPASRWQADGIESVSRVVDSRIYSWQNPGWTGRPWHEAVIYELHVGTFTPEGTFRAAAAHLAALADLGFTAIELMPIATFKGKRGWGYDGVLAYAPHPAYGTPDDLRHLVDTAHSVGMMAILDVVYNHMGVHGNVLEDYAPQFFSSSASPWGPSPDFSRSETRNYFTENALSWLTDFRLDGLRFDASDLLVANHHAWLVDEIADLVEDRIAGRHVHLVVEDARNATGPLEPRGEKPPSCTAAWNDDFHHAVHVLTTGETVGYYRDFADDPCAGLRTALAEGFIYQGQPRPSKDSAPCGEPSGHLPPTCFIDFLQNHDQIGNRLKGDRLSTLIDAATFKALTALLYLSPHTPLTFMGEEFGARQSFFFFSDNPPETHEEACKARAKEADNFGGTLYDADTPVADPNALETFLASKIDWKQREEERSLTWQGFVKELLALRRAHIWPLLDNLSSAQGIALPAPDKVIAVNWQLDHHLLELRCNLGNKTVEAPPTSGDVFFRLEAEPGETALPRGAVILAAGPGATGQDPVR